MKGHYKLGKVFTLKIKIIKFETKLVTKSNTIEFGYNLLAALYVNESLKTYIYVDCLNLT